VVPKKSSSSQLVINMQLLNVAISPPCFKYKDLALLAPLLKEGDYMTTIDLKDGFFHVPVLPSHQAYMSQPQLPTSPLQLSVLRSWEQGSGLPAQ